LNEKIINENTIKKTIEGIRADNIYNKYEKIGEKKKKL